MTIGKNIVENRRRKNITQETLAQKLGVTNQAVSKWELDQACPDIQLLPMLADIFEISIDNLLGHEKNNVIANVQGLPWADDEILRVVVYQGHRLLKHAPAEADVVFVCEGPALNIDSAVSVSCGDVKGSIDAGKNITCGDVGGDADAGGSVMCGNVEGDVDAGGSVSCGNVGGSVDAGGRVECGNIGGDVDAGGSVSCGSVDGDVNAGSSVTFQK